MNDALLVYPPSFISPLLPAQIMFAVPSDVASHAPSGYIRTTSGGGRMYNLYVNSYLGYGLMAGRKAILEENGPGPNPCIPADFSGLKTSPPQKKRKNRV